MAKPLTFNYAGSEVAFEMSKVDRAKLYGFKEVEVLDDDGQKCTLATLASDGRTIVGRGGAAQGYVNSEGLWAEKARLKPVDIDGHEIEPVTSSFSAPVPLTERVDIDEYLNHNIRSVYQLQTESAADDLLKELTDGTIFKFDFSYRGGLEADAAFLLTNGEGELFMAIGTPTTVEFIGLQQTAAVAVEEEPAADDTGDMMDFGMI